MIHHGTISPCRASRSVSIALFTLTLIPALVACASPRGPYSPHAASARDSLKAQALSQQAAGLLETNPAKAESLLREALTADLYHAPAHNNLGVLYLTQNRLYESATELEWASKLLPGHPDPRMNLAIVLERAGRTDDALAAYTSALDAYPAHIGATQGLARLQIRAGRTDARTPALLTEIAMRGEDDHWRQWARLETIRTAGDRQP